jgi:hypothetical protein
MPTNPGFRVEALYHRYPRARPLFVDHRVLRALDYANTHSFLRLIPTWVGFDGRVRLCITNVRGASQHT